MIEQVSLQHKQQVNRKLCNVLVIYIYFMDRNPFHCLMLAVISFLNVSAGYTSSRKMDYFYQPV